MITDSHWKRIGVSHHHGICVPLFSLHTKKGGFGNFYDLMLLIDWCKKVGFDCIQLLPLNDTGMDASPYNSVSSCALDPVYIYVPNLVIPPVLSRQESKQRKLDALKREPRPAQSELQSFLLENPWLKVYAEFKAREEQQEEDFTYFLQWKAFQQFKEVKMYAEKRQVFLKGDISILVSPESADVWAYPDLFDLRFSAGAPPDRYNYLGQNWGFPLFQWPAHRATQFSWWKERLQVAERLYHIYRIDHVVGFFRIWAIPPEEPPNQGHFIPENPNLCEQQGRELLQMMVANTHMLPIAEDLGTIPEYVTKTLHEFGICGTKVMRWEHIPPQNYDPISMTTVSTPDMEPLQLWWRATHQRDLSREERRKILFEAHHSASLFHINLLQEYLALFPELVSANPEEERINVPGTVNPKNWSYRFKPTLEEIVEHRELAKEIQRMVQ